MKGTEGLTQIVADSGKLFGYSYERAVDPTDLQADLSVRYVDEMQGLYLYSFYIRDRIEMSRWDLQELNI